MALPTKKKHMGRKQRNTGAKAAELGANSTDPRVMSERNPQNKAGTQHWIRFMVVAP
jgi:hypothetical protein